MESRYCGTSVPWYMPPYRPALFVHRKLFYVSTIVGFVNVVALVITFLYRYFWCLAIPEATAKHYTMILSAFQQLLEPECGTVCRRTSDNRDRLIRPVQAITEDMFIWTVRPRHSVNSLTAPSRNILTYLLTSFTFCTVAILRSDHNIFVAQHLRLTAANHVHWLKIDKTMKCIHT